ISVTIAVTSPLASNEGVKGPAPSRSLFKADGGWKTGAIVSAIVHEAEEASLLSGIVPELACKGCRERCRTRLLYTTHGHAHMFGLDHDRDPARLQCLIDGGCDLGCQVFLCLQAAPEDLDNPGNL